MTDTADSQQVRYAWVDTLKILGMFAIYIGHFADLAGFSYSYVFTYHVPLFFFMAGFFAIPTKEISLLPYIKKNFIAILIPYFVFNFITLFAWGLQANLTLSQIKPYVFLIFSGIRNKLTPAYSLWFLPCLFLMKTTYYMLYRLFKKKVIVLFISIAMMYFALSFFPKEPSFFLNVDSMFAYIFYYALGASIFKYLKKLNYSGMAVWGKILWWSILLVIAGLSMLIYFKRADKLFEILSLVGFLNLRAIMIPIIGIILNMYLSFWLSKFRVLAEFGKKTLMFCGNEQFVKLLVPSIFSVLGISIAPKTPLDVFLYTIALLAFVYYLLVPIEYKLFPILKKAS